MKHQPHNPYSSDLPQKIIKAYDAGMKRTEYLIYLLKEDGKDLNQLQFDDNKRIINFNFKK